MKKCAVIIPAYKAEKYIKQCYRSIQNQKIPDGWEIEIRIGVDGCEETAAAIDISFYKSEKNIGAYVMRNSLIALGHADAYAYFDADDVMQRGYFMAVLPLLEQHPAVMTAKTNCNENLEPIRRNVIEKGGAITFTHAVLSRLGGFREFRCACDTDFMERLTMAGFEIHYVEKSYYLRRSHPGQLTKVKETAYKSEYRKVAWDVMTADREKGKIKITPEIFQLEYIINDGQWNGRSIDSVVPPVYILIRTSGRPVFFAEMMKSVEEQDYKNIVTIVHTDSPEDDYVYGDIIIHGDKHDSSVGTAPYNLYCNALLDSIPAAPGWFCFLDDDDKYEGPDVITRLVAGAKRGHINVGRVKRWNGTIWPRRWRIQQTFQTECFLLHTDHRALGKWWPNKGGDHYYTKQITSHLPINWIDDLIVARAQVGKGHGLCMDLPQGEPERKRVSKVGARHLGPPVEVEFIRRVTGRTTQRGRKGEIKKIPLKYAERLEKVGRVRIIRENEK